MTKRKFTPPTKFPAEYVDTKGGKVVILGIGPNEQYPTTHLSAEEDDGSHWCKISKDCLAQARTTLAEMKGQDDGR